MIIKGNGEMVFSDVYELTYEVLNTLDFEVKSNGIIMDTRTDKIVAFNNMILKATINANKINYPGVGEIACDVLNNVRIVTMLLGLLLERKRSEGMPFRSYYNEETTDEKTDLKYSKITIKFDDYNELSTKSYHNKCLKFIEAIFLLEEDRVDLSNFDSLEI